ncbi:MAG: response regulator transcription factor [Arcicella sp.]|nr:response regulator transcription factor [Arcicella sp.]
MNNPKNYIKKVIVVEDHQILLESISLLISTIPNIELVGKASNGLKAMQILENEEVDIIVSDVQMPVMNGIELTWKVKQQFPHIKVLMLTVSEDSQTIKNALQAGADGFIFKSAEREELEMAMESLMNNKKYFSDKAILSLAEAQNEVFISDKEALKTMLTERELQILKLISQEMSGIQIAEKLFISPTTVESHRKNLFSKIGVNTSVGLVKYALKHGIS